MAFSCLNNLSWIFWRNFKQPPHKKLKTIYTWEAYQNLSTKTIMLPIKINLKFNSKVKSHNLSTWKNQATSPPKKDSKKNFLWTYQLTLKKLTFICGQITHPLNKNCTSSLELFFGRKITQPLKNCIGPTIGISVSEWVRVSEWVSEWVRKIKRPLHKKM